MLRLLAFALLFHVCLMVAAVLGVQGWADSRAQNSPETIWSRSFRRKYRRALATAVLAPELALALIVWNAFRPQGGRRG